MISCLTVTRNRAEKLETIINCFKSQTYKNKELVIIYEEDDEETKKYLETKKEEDIKIYEISVKPKLTLGELRNISVEKARGDYICQWDDDDWYHCARLETQMRALKEKNKLACLMNQWIIYDKTKDKTYLSNKRIWEGSLLCDKKIFKHKKYPSIKRGEDSDVINYIVNAGLAVLLNTPQLYIYVIHGYNTWDSKHFLGFLRSSNEINIKFTKNLFLKDHCYEGSYILNKLFK